MEFMLVVYHKKQRLKPVSLKSFVLEPKDVNSYAEGGQDFVQAKQLNTYLVSFNSTFSQLNFT